MKHEIVSYIGGLIEATVWSVYVDKDKMCVRFSTYLDNQAGIVSLKDKLAKKYGDKYRFDFAADNEMWIEHKIIEK